MKPECSLVYSHMLATCPYSESPHFHHKNKQYTIHVTTGTPYASVERDASGPYIVTDVCIHNKENIKNYERVREEARYCTVMLLQQYRRVNFNVRNVEL
jgi:hypothetical protein